jgi:hypothetical protein
MERTVTAKILSSRNRRKKEDGIGESQPFREGTLSLHNVIPPGLESNPRTSAYEADANKLTRLAHWIFDLVPWWPFFRAIH